MVKLRLSVGILSGAIVPDAFSILLIFLQAASVIASPTAEIALNGSEYYHHPIETKSAGVVDTNVGQSAAKYRSDYVSSSVLQTEQFNSPDSSFSASSGSAEGGNGWKSEPMSTSAYQLTMARALEADSTSLTASMTDSQQMVTLTHLLPVGGHDLENRTASVRGIRIEDAHKGVGYENKGVSIVLADSGASLRLFGDRFTRHTIIRFVTEMGARGSDCDDLTSTRSFPLQKTDITQHSAVSIIQLPPLDVGEETFYLCVRENNTDMPWVHQGTEQWIQMKSYKAWLPLWAHIVILIALLGLSGLFSGLNLGLMAIDRTEIQILVNTGTDKERRYAKKIQPLRDNGNYLLCSLLLGNVIVNSTLTILLDDLTTGIVAVVASSLGIVIFGEIIPQAFCSRHGLAVGARTIWLTKFFMAVTFPVSYPISVLLDKVLGEEIGNVYNRDRLKELIKVTHQYNDLEKDEVNIIAGALEMKQKTVGHIMTKLENVFMLPIESVLDFDTVSEIMSQGYSRIPVYEGTRSNVISLLYTKDLAFVDPDDKMPLKTICEFYNNSCNYVFETITLDVIFREFKQGERGHMAFVQRIHGGGHKEDPYYEVVGLVTMEDVIEELIQAEINDETDVWDLHHRRRSRATANANSELALIRWKSEGIHVSPQLVLAAFQYLSTSIEEFNEQRISKTILQRLLNQNLFFHIKVKNRDTAKSDPANVIYERGKAADCFVLILEGRVQAEMGRESLVFESGPFTFFGTQSLNQNIGVGEAPSSPTATRKSSNLSANIETLLYSTFVPDYTVRAVTDVTFLRISRSIYMAAKQATLLEKTYALGDTAGHNNVGDNFELEIDKMVSNGRNNGFNNAVATNDIRLYRTNSYRGYFPRKDGTGVKRASEIFSEIILTPNLLITDYDKDDSLRSKRNSLIPPSRKMSTVSSITFPMDNYCSNSCERASEPLSRPSSPSREPPGEVHNDDVSCKL